MGNARDGAARAIARGPRAGGEAPAAGTSPRLMAAWDASWSSRRRPRAGGVRGRPATHRRHRRGDGLELAPVHSSVQRRGWSDAEILLPGSPFPAHRVPAPWRAGGRLGGDRGGLRLLRSGAYDPRFPRLFRPQSGQLPVTPRRTHEPRAAMTVG